MFFRVRCLLDQTPLASGCCFPFGQRQHRSPRAYGMYCIPGPCSLLLPHTLSSPHAQAAGYGAGHPVSHPPVTPYQQAAVCRGRPSQVQVSADALCTETFCVCPGSFRWPGDRALALTGQHHELLHHSVAGSTHFSMRPESPSQPVLPQLQFIFILALLSSLCLNSVDPV